MDPEESVRCTCLPDTDTTGALPQPPYPSSIPTINRAGRRGRRAPRLILPNTPDQHPASINSSQYECHRTRVFERKNAI